MNKTMAILNENNIVINIAVFNNDQDETDTLITYTNANPAQIGGDYFEGYFYHPQPYPSWTRDKGQWISPIPYPDDLENYYVWNETDQSWDLIDD
jgi:hypothetical protein